MSESENAVQSQIWCAVASYVLIASSKKNGDIQIRASCTTE
jgi:hypothetical protein